MNFQIKRRFFLKESLIAGITLSVTDILQTMPAPDYSSQLKLSCSKHFPQFDFFSIDSLGKNNLDVNIILNEIPGGKNSYIVTNKKDKTSYHLSTQNKNEPPAWEVTIKNNSFTIVSNYVAGYEQPFVFNISQYENHATLLGIIETNEQKVNIPAVLHCPDMGTLRITCIISNQTIKYDAKRYIEHPYVKMEFSCATAISPEIEYKFEVVTIYPKIKGLENNARYDCFRKNFISIFQLNPFLKILANNSASDACAFTLFKYSEVALKTPPLAENLTAMDLIKMTLDRYLNGTKGYGMLGYDYDKTWDIPESDTKCNTLDTYPSLLIAACNYLLYTNDKNWLLTNKSKLQIWIDKMLKADLDNDGLLEFCLSGNSRSWKGDSSMRPANWWDTIGFGHKDAYSNALAYYALILLEKVHSKFDIKEAEVYKMKAEKLRNIYTKTFYNNETGILAGWKSADGKLHDYWFTFVNAIAICYDLIETSLANSIMDKILMKMKEVGYTNFELGLPGNLIPVIRADYTDLKPEVGGGKREDNLDGFQIYENGGATACYTYFTIHALQKLGRKKDADMILLPLLKSMSEGGFQGRCADNGRTKDWKTWTGECWGYEGFLVDNYMFLLCVLEN